MHELFLKIYALCGLGAMFDFYDAVMIDATVLMGLDVVARRVIGSSIWLINDSTAAGIRSVIIFFHYVSREIYSMHCNYYKRYGDLTP